MGNRLDKVLEDLQMHREQMTESEQDAIAKVIEAVFADQTPIDPLKILTAEELAEIERRVSSPVDAADPVEVNAFFAKHGIRSNF
jgi:hypothetical protein